MIRLLIDLLFAVGTFCFTVGAIIQFRKVYVTHKTGGVSLRNHLIKIFALICVSIACILSTLLITLFVNIIQLILTLGLVYMLVTYRKINLFKYCRELIKL